MDPIGNDVQLELVIAFINYLEKTLDVQSEYVSFEQMWLENPPAQANGASLSEYMKDVALASFCYEDYRNLQHSESTTRSSSGGMLILARLSVAMVRFLLLRRGAMTYDWKQETVVSHHS
jgi:hypothetical protein